MPSASSPGFRWPRGDQWERLYEITINEAPFWKRHEAFAERAWLWVIDWKSNPLLLAWICGNSDSSFGNVSNCRETAVTKTPEDGIERMKYIFDRLRCLGLDIVFWICCKSRLSNASAEVQRGLEPLGFSETCEIASFSQCLTTAFAIPLESRLHSSFCIQWFEFFRNFQNETNNSTVKNVNGRNFFVYLPYKQWSALSCNFNDSRTDLWNFWKWSRLFRVVEK